MKVKVKVKVKRDRVYVIFRDGEAFCFFYDSESAHLFYSVNAHLCPNYTWRLQLMDIEEVSL